MRLGEGEREILDAASARAIQRDRRRRGRCIQKLHITGRNRHSGETTLFTSPAGDKQPEERGWQVLGRQSTMRFVLFCPLHHK